MAVLSERRSGDECRYAACGREGAVEAARQGRSEVQIILRIDPQHRRAGGLAQRPERRDQHVLRAYGDAS